MAKPYEVDQGKVDVLVKAATDGDGTTARQLLDEVGSCGWPSLLRQAQEQTRTNRFKLVHSSESNGSLDFVQTYMTNGVVITPLAKSYDQRCKSKW